MTCGDYPHGQLFLPAHTGSHWCRLQLFNSCRVVTVRVIAYCREEISCFPSAYLPHLPAFISFQFIWCGKVYPEACFARGGNKVQEVIACQSDRRAVLLRACTNQRGCIIATWEMPDRGSIIMSVGEKEKTAPREFLESSGRCTQGAGVRRLEVFAHWLSKALGALNGDAELVHWPEGPQLESHHFHCFQIKI